MSYVDFLMAGIFVQTGIFAATQTGVGLADDLQKGIIDRLVAADGSLGGPGGRTAADTVSVGLQTVLMLIVAYLQLSDPHERVGGVARLRRGRRCGTYLGVRLRRADLKTIEAVQAALFTIVFPFVFVSSAFVPPETFPSWLQPIAQNNPVTIWVNLVRVLTLGDLITEPQPAVLSDVPSLWTCSGSRPHGWRASWPSSTRWASAPAPYVARPLPPR